MHLPDTFKTLSTGSRAMQKPACSLIHSLCLVALTVIAGEVSAQEGVSAPSLPQNLTTSVEAAPVTNPPSLVPLDPRLVAPIDPVSKKPLYDVNDLIPQESQDFDTEAEKLEAIRQLVRERHKNWRSAYPGIAVEIFKKANKKPPAELIVQAKKCDQTYKDFLANRHISVIEPDFKIYDANDPRLARWDQCATYDYAEGIPETAYWGTSNVGGPPYRIYRIDLDDNSRNSQADVIYSGSVTPLDYWDTTGYFRVDLKKCVRVWGWGNAGSGRTTKRNNLLRLNTLIRYRGIPTVVAFHPKSDTPPHQYYFDMASLNPHPKGRKLRESCSWIEVFPQQ